MLLISMGTSYWPQTAEGRVLCFLLAVYGFAIFGYVTAALASFFIGRDAEAEETELVSAKPLQELRGEVALLREEIGRLRKGGSI
jgi:voltage-gated potassium channel